MITEEALLAQWFELTRGTLPALANQHGWPIRFDHCFQRVCLDHVFGGPWRRHIEAPAYKTLNSAQLTKAVAIARSIVDSPGTLTRLNSQSIAWRTA